MDEKIFTAEQKFNKQNDKMYARTWFKVKTKVDSLRKSKNI